MLTRSIKSLFVTVLLSAKSSCISAFCCPIDEGVYCHCISALFASLLKTASGSAFTTVMLAVLPAGVGQTELQVRAAVDIATTAYAGTPALG